MTECDYFRNFVKYETAESYISLNFIYVATHLYGQHK